MTGVHVSDAIGNGPVSQPQFDPPELSRFAVTNGDSPKAGPDVVSRNGVSGLVKRRGDQASPLSP